MLPGPWTIQVERAWENIHPTPHFTNEETRIQECLPRATHVPHLRGATCNLFSLMLLFCCPGEPCWLPQLVVNCLRAVTGSAHHPCSSSQGVQQHPGVVRARRVLVLGIDGAKTMVPPFPPRTRGLVLYSTATPCPPLPGQH